MGALVGGILENVSMIFGIAALNLLALAIYFLSYVSLHKQEWLLWRGWRVESSHRCLGH